MNDPDVFLAEHQALSRRFFLSLGAAGAAAAAVAADAQRDKPLAPELLRAIDKLEPYFTVQEHFNDVSRGKPLPHSLDEAKKREVGLTRETWKLEVVSDPDHPAKLGKQLVRKDGSETGLVKRTTSRWFYYLLQRVGAVDLPAGASDYRLLSQRVVDVVRTQIGERNPFLRGLVSWVGFNMAAYGATSGTRSPSARAIFVCRT